MVSPRIGPVQNPLKLLETDSLSPIEKGDDNIPQAKVCEYANGAETIGEGVTNIPVTSNQGRTVLYRQKGQNKKYTLQYDIKEPRTSERSLEFTEIESFLMKVKTSHIKNFHELSLSFFKSISL